MYYKRLNYNNLTPHEGVCRVSVMSGICMASQAIAIIKALTLLVIVHVSGLGERGVLPKTSSVAMKYKSTRLDIRNEIKKHDHEKILAVEAPLV